MKKNKTLIIVAVVAVIVVFWFIGAQNGLVTKEEAVTAQWSEVENMYQRRLDLIPNLVETVKGYASHEKDVFTNVTEMRSRVGQMNISSDILDNPEAMQKFQQAQNELGGALTRLLAVSENYPELKANQNFIALQSQLEGSENRIAVARRRFIQSVQDYNTSIRRFPNSLVAAIGGFDKKATFTAAEGADSAPDVKF